MVEDRLNEIYIQKIRGSNVDFDELKKNDTELYLVYLLSVFSYNVSQGGFAQLIYNLNGLYLEDLELSLEIVGADHSKNALSEVIKFCFDNKASYQKFTEGGFDETEFKNKLHKYSLNYFSKKLSLNDEISESTFIEMCHAAGIS